VYKKLLIGLLFCQVAMAENIPQSVVSSKSIKYVSYKKDAVVPINGAPFTVTVLQLEKGEAIESVEDGDSLAWIVKPVENEPNMLRLKPTVDHSFSDTNLVVTTDKDRTYFFRLHILGAEDHIAPTYAVIFRYPQEELALRNYKKQQNAANLSGAEDPSAFNWDYTFNLQDGAERIMPTHVYDDGKFTYLQFDDLDKNPVPAIFAVDGTDGKESVVNFRRKGNIITILRVAPQFTLRQGDMVASIFNKPMIKKLKSY
jgi:type IV secretion system protein VirB9